MTPLDLTRHQVLAHRVASQQLDRSHDGPLSELAVLDLGVADTPAGSARQSLAVRTGRRPAVQGDDPTGADDGPEPWATAWATRGAPHLLRAADLAGLAAALWPLSSDDASARLAGTGPALRKQGADPLEVLAATAEAFGRVVDRAMPKGEASAALTEQVPAEAVTWCRPCASHHLADQLMRLAALPGGVRLIEGERTATVAPVEGWTGPPSHAAGLDTVILRYLDLYGPATKADVAAFLGTKQAPLASVWPADRLTEVRIDGRRAWVASDAVEGLLAAPPPRLTRLLPRGDPWLLARDRKLTVPDDALRKALWPVLGQPGALLVDGEIVGVWRTKATTRRLTITVSAAHSPTGATQREVDREARLIAAVRGLDDVQVDWV